MAELGGADDNSKKSKNRVCAFSYKHEKDLPDGQKLLTCARCRETCYIDRESQLEHWPIHKHSCCKAEHEKFDPRQVQEMSLEGLVSTVKFLLAAPDLIKGRFLLCIFKEILDRIIYNHDISLQEAHLFHTLNESFAEVFSVPPIGENGEEGETSGLPNKTLHRIWAIPGFASFFLSDDIFLSKPMREAKREGLLPPPPQKYIDGVLDPATKYDPELQVSPVYWTVVARFFVYSSCFLELAPDEERAFIVHQPTRLSVAIKSRFLRSWACRYARVSIPSIDFAEDSNHDEGMQLLPRSTFLSMFLPHPGYFLDQTSPVKKYMKAGELYPGLTLKEMLMTLMDDETYFHTIGDGRDATIFVTHLVDFVQRAPLEIQNVSTRERIELLERWLGWWQTADYRNIMSIPTHVIFSHLDGPKLPMPVDQAMFLLCSSFSTKAFLDVYQELYDPKSPSDMVARSSALARLVGSKYKCLVQEEYEKVGLMVDVLTSAYRERMRTLGEMEYPFPNELNFLIAEFALPRHNNFVVAVKDAISSDDEEDDDTRYDTSEEATLEEDESQNMR